MTPRRLLLALIFLTINLTIFAANPPLRDVYQLTIYHYKLPEQGKVIDTYLRDALLPAYHRLGIKKIGVFTAIANDTASDKLVYVLVPFRSLSQSTEMASRLTRDTGYASAGKEYLDAPYTAPAFTRKEVILLNSFEEAPLMQTPKLTSAPDQRVYELRSYEGASEKIFNNKVKMFNKGGEVRLFKRLNFNALFYAEVIAGSKMPNLMYMTSFENMQDRDAHWKAFGQDSEWKNLSSQPEYQNNVSHIDITFLRPTSYSDL
jgi:hypothetical protein